MDLFPTGLLGKLFSCFFNHVKILYLPKTERKNKGKKSKVPSRIISSFFWLDDIQYLATSNLILTFFLWNQHGHRGKTREE